MSDWPREEAPFVGLAHTVISPASDLSIGGLYKSTNSAAMSASNAWPATNRALFVPFRVPRTCVAYQMAAGFGATAGNNFDLGIYDLGGNRLVSTGSTARVASSEVIVNITDTVLPRGNYYLAMSVDGTPTVQSVVPSHISNCKMAGMYEMASAFALPATATFATISTAFIPQIGVFLNAVT